MVSIKSMSARVNGEPSKANQVLLVDHIKLEHKILLYKLGTSALIRASFSHTESWSQIIP